MKRLYHVVFAICCIILGLWAVPAVTAQDTGIPSLIRNSFTFNLAFYADAVRFEDNIFSHQVYRKSVNDKNTRMLSLPFSNLDWLGDDSNLGVGFESRWFGGKYSFKKSNIANFGAVQGWVKFGLPDLYLKIIAGNDNDFTYADSLGADPGMRVYLGTYGDAWKDYKDPDNITQGNGIALNGVWKALTLDLAAGQYSVVPLKTQSVKPGTANTYGDTENVNFQYGGRLGWQFGDFAKINGSYVINYEKYGGRFGWNTVNLEIVPQAPNAVIFTHSFGIYAGLSPLKEFGITVGYGAIITEYLDKYWTINGDLYTTFPRIWRHGINLNARYNGLFGGSLRLRTDNNMTIYKDKDYRVFDILGALWNSDFNPTVRGQNYAEIQHFFLWNGLGIEYDLFKLSEGRRLMIKLYARNMFRQDLAVSNTVKQEYRYTRDEVMADLQAMYFFSEKVSVFAGLRYQNMATIRSKDMTGQTTGFFLDSFKMPQDAVETTDYKTSLSIPVGMLLSW